MYSIRVHILPAKTEYTHFEYILLTKKTLKLHSASKKIILIFEFKSNITVKNILIPNGKEINWHLKNPYE